MSESSFKISMQWAEPFTPCVTEEEVSLGDMTIEANGQILTKNFSYISDGLREHIRVASYPLAVWFAASWWRLLYEPVPSGEQIEKSYGWKNAHMMASASNGYIWPNICFIPDGQFVTITSPQQYSSSASPLFYLGTKDAIVVERGVFIEAIRDFITVTIGRLDELGKKETDLHTLFMQLSREMEDNDFSLYRQIEAQLGYDPDEVPSAFMEKIESALAVFTGGTLTELLSACSINETTSPDSDIESALSMSRTGLKGRWKSPLSIKLMRGMLPWEAGRLLARQLREFIGNKEKKIETKTLCDFFEITSKELANSYPAHERFSVSCLRMDKLYINLKKECSDNYSTGRRFQLARLIGALLFSSNENVFVMSDCKTYFQKVQRAFAAEFLSPIVEIQNFIQKNVTTETIGKAAKYFSVSPRTIAHSLTNHGIISQMQLSELVF